MSRRTIALLSVFFAVLVIANVVVLALWLPNRKVNASTSVPGASLTAGVAPASSPAATAIAAGVPSPPPSQQQQQQPPQAQGSNGFVVERQISSSSGNLRLKYLRDRSTKLRRISVEDARQPNGGTILYEAKHSAWALISPDDQWVVVAERAVNGRGDVQLYHRTNASAAQFARVQANAGSNLQETVWKAYLKATEADPNTPRDGATINALAWENDSHRIDLSVAYIAGPNNPEVPAPWSCTYDVTSQQVTQTSAPPADQADNDSADVQETAATDTANNPFADSSNDSNASNESNESGDGDEVADNEFPGEKFPATRLDELTVPDVNESSLDEINYAINEMYARHGVDFKDKKVTGQFSDFSWYQPRPGFGPNDAETEFSDLEKSNLKTLQRCRDAKIASSKRKSRPARGQKVEEETTGEKVLRGIRQWQEMGAPMPPHP
jgi:hypothetical protein